MQNASLDVVNGTDKIHFRFADFKRVYYANREYKWNGFDIASPGIKVAINAVNKELATAEAPILLDVCERHWLQVDDYLCASSYWQIPFPRY